MFLKPVEMLQYSQQAKNSIFQREHHQIIKVRQSGIMPNGFMPNLLIYEKKIKERNKA